MDYEHHEHTPYPDDLSAPPIWREHRAEGPSRPINHAFVYIDGKKAGRIDRPMGVMELDRFLLAELYPVLDKPGTHEVRIDFRAASGRGALAQIRFTINELADGSLEFEEPHPSAHSETSALATLTAKLLAQNEKLLKHVMDATSAQAATQMTGFESITQMMMMSLERDRERHTTWAERNERDREFQANRVDSLAANHQAEQKELYAMLMAMNAGNQQQAGGIMAGVQDHITGRVMETLMEKFDGVLEGGGQAASPAAQILGALGPVLAEKLGGAKEPKPEVKLGGE